MIVTASEMKNGFGQCLKHVTEENGEVIITKNNVRVARLVPYVSDIEKYFAMKENAVDYDYNKKTVSYEEFMEIYSKTSTRMEYLNGEIIIMESPNFDHQAILGDLHVIFMNFFKGKQCRPLVAPFDVHFRKKDIKDPDVLQPDLIVICDIENNVNERRRYTGTPALTLEITSDGTRSRDMVYKLNSFMASGVSEYWIVDIRYKRIIIYTFEDLAADRMDIYETGEMASSVAFKGLAVDVAELFSGIPERK